MVHAQTPEALAESLVKQYRAAPHDSYAASMNLAQFMRLTPTECTHWGMTGILPVDFMARHNLAAKSASTLDALQAQIQEWHSRELSPTPDVLATAAKVCAEAGEHIDAVIKSREVRNDGVDWTQNARTEMGDVLISLCAAAWAQGWSLAEVVAERWETIRVRKYATRVLDKS